MLYCSIPLSEKIGGSKCELLFSGIYFIGKVHVVLSETVKTVVVVKRNVWYIDNFVNVMFITIWCKVVLRCLLVYFPMIVWEWQKQDKTELYTFEDFDVDIKSGLS